MRCLYWTRQSGRWFDERARPERYFFFGGCFVLFDMALRSWEITKGEHRKHEVENVLRILNAATCPSTPPYNLFTQCTRSPNLTLPQYPRLQPFVLHLTSSDHDKYRSMQGVMPPEGISAVGSPTPDPASSESSSKSSASCCSPIHFAISVKWLNHLLLCAQDHPHPLAVGFPKWVVRVTVLCP